MKQSVRIETICIILVFLAILLVGLFVFNDYGLNIDESIQRQHSLISYRSVARIVSGREVFPDAGPPLQEYPHKYYGVAMQLPLVFAEDMYAQITGAPMPSRTIYLMRHLYTFLVYYFALICFYLLLKRLFGSRWLAITGVLMVFLFGRFFAHSFYNIKDMLFASLFMISLCCAERVFATDRKPLWCILFALSGALLVTSRIVGALLIVLVLLTMLIQDIAVACAAKRSGCSDASVQKSLWKQLIPYLLICCAYPIWIVVTPAAWCDPIGFSLGYISVFSNYTVWQGSVVFAGEVFAYNTVPRSFQLVWIAITVPIVNQIFCLFGVGSFIYNQLPARRYREDVAAQSSVLWLLLFILVGILGYQIIFQPTVYTDWRHVFFLYPCIIVFAVYGLFRLWRWGDAHKRRWLQIGVSCMIAVSLLFNGARIIQNHPNQYAMFNIFGSRCSLDYDRDYYYLSFHDLTKWVLKDSNASQINLWLYDDGITPAYIGALLSSEEFARFEFLPLESSEYVILSYACMPGTNSFPVGTVYDLNEFEEVYSIIVDGAKLSSVYRRVDS